jgi:hypothetical protein
MRIALLAVGVLVALIGLIWVGQGTGYFPYPSSSFMINQMPWAYGGMALGGLRPHRRRHCAPDLRPREAGKLRRSWHHGRCDFCATLKPSSQHGRPLCKTNRENRSALANRGGTGVRLPKTSREMRRG